MIHRILLPLLVLTSVSYAGNWPEWRGPSAQGQASASGLPETWSETSNIAWKTELPGRGHSTPVMWGEQIWLTTAIEKAATPEEAKRRLESNTGDQPLTVLGSVSLHALCVDRSSGKILHDIELLNVKDPQWAHQLNSYASPSPVLADGRLYAHFGSFGTVALDTKTLKVLWKNEELHVMHENGPGSTAVLHGDRLIAHCRIRHTQRQGRMENTPQWRDGPTPAAAQSLRHTPGGDDQWPAASRQLSRQQCLWL